MRPKYIPFLKAKANEFGAIKVLEDTQKDVIAPFFDLPFKKDMTADLLKKVIDGAARKFALNMKGVSEYFVDDYDIPDNLIINGKQGYEYFAERMFAENLNFNPVVGLDRSAARQSCVFSAAIRDIAKNRRVALRVTADDLSDYRLVRSDILDLIRKGEGVYDRWVLVIDNRVCLGADAATRATQIASFCSAAYADHAYEGIVITGSSLPPVIGDILATNNEIHLVRNEIGIYNLAVKLISDAKIFFGDYTVVSPNYSDSDIAPQNMLNVTAPKVVYSYSQNHYIVRGGSLKSHPRGFKQYNDIAAKIVAQPFFRHNFSAGDLFLADKALGNGSNVMPGSILKPTINSHITYMISIL